MRWGEAARDRLIWMVGVAGDLHLECQGQIAQLCRRPHLPLSALASDRSADRVRAPPIDGDVLRVGAVSRRMTDHEEGATGSRRAWPNLRSQ